MSDFWTPANVHTDRRIIMHMYAVRCRQFSVSSRSFREVDFISVVACLSVRDLRILASYMDLQSRECLTCFVCGKYTMRFDTDMFTAGTRLCLMCDTELSYSFVGSLLGAALDGLDRLYVVKLPNSGALPHVYSSKRCAYAFDR